MTRHGVLVVDKPSGSTSHDVVAQARRLFGERSVGHAGTLDPMATGVLLLLFGEACKLSDYLSGQSKTYLATLEFGRATDTLDADGRVIAEHALTPGWLSDAALTQALAREAERHEQVPPNVSAIHTDGERAHVRARRGDEFTLPARPVSVSALSVRERTEQSLSVELSVSKGYYVRAFARDVGETLGVPTHLSRLRRIRSGSFSESEAQPWPPSREALPPLEPLEQAARRALPTTELDEQGALFARQGKLLTADQARPSAFDEVSAWFAPDGTLVALGRSSLDGGHRVVRGFVPKPSPT